MYEGKARPEECMMQKGRESVEGRIEGRKEGKIVLVFVILYVVCHHSNDVAS